MLAPVGYNGHVIIEVLLGLITVFFRLNLEYMLDTQSIQTNSPVLLYQTHSESAFARSTFCIPHQCEYIMPCIVQLIVQRRPSIQFCVDSAISEGSPSYCIPLLTVYVV